ncbi:hypothetical protein Kpho01_18800 [Kitasatospora phosalacinea]|uniref:Uncharacterized protein n=1 Tax=Kitasatospora phosalacinea TaxID=2065 RepID=A0A9W6PF65_9ACTN|nr:hypothetical protein Kpho01_18800 [Kitasatospora phosalacinea]
MPLKRGAVDLKPGPPSPKRTPPARALTARSPKRPKPPPKRRGPFLKRRGLPPKRARPDLKRPPSRRDSRGAHGPLTGARSKLREPWPKLRGLPLKRTPPGLKRPRSPHSLRALLRPAPHKRLAGAERPADPTGGVGKRS